MQSLEPPPSLDAVVQKRYSATQGQVRPSLEVKRALVNQVKGGKGQKWPCQVSAMCLYRQQLQGPCVQVQTSQSLHGNSNIPHRHPSIMPQQGTKVSVLKRHSGVSCKSSESAVHFTEMGSSVGRGQWLASSPLLPWCYFPVGAEKEGRQEDGCRITGGESQGRVKDKYLNTR